ncbi:MAG: TonB-dependent receptor [Bacteroidales bacterium]|nr:TonB-dependent receptor [Bacteroidales bacterium]
MKKILTILIVIGFGTGNLMAQPPGKKVGLKVSGRVLNSYDNLPMEYVSVVLTKSSDSNIVTGTITKKDGTFEITQFKPGIYNLKVEFVGFDRYIETGIKVTPSQPHVVIPDIKMKMKSLGISEVEVLADGPSVSYQLDKKVISVSRDLASRGGTAVEILENIPSVESDMNGNVTLRGSSNFIVLINGRQSPISGGDALNQISANSIERMEIITNPSAKYDPDGTSGIINVITKKGKYKGYSLLANTSLGNANTYSTDVNLTYKSQKFSYTILGSVRNNYTDTERIVDRYSYDGQSFPDNTDTVTSTHTNNNGYFGRRNINFSAELRYLVTQNDLFYIAGGYSDFRLLRGGVSQNMRYYSYNENKDYYLSDAGIDVHPGTWQFVIGNKHEFGRPGHFINAELTVDRKHKNKTSNSLQYISDSTWILDTSLVSLDRSTRTKENRKRFRIELDYENQVSENIKLEAGAIIRLENALTDYYQYENDSTDEKFRYYRNIYGGYAILSGVIKNTALNYSFGLRAEYTDRRLTTANIDQQLVNVDNTLEYGYSKLEWYPSAALSYEFENKNVLQLLYSRRIERPRDYILYPETFLTDGFNSSQGNPELLPEHTNAYELNYQFVWGKSYLALETFYRDTRDAHDRIQSVNDQGTLERSYANIDRMEFMGLELWADFSVAKWWKVNPGATIYYNIVNGIYGGEGVYKTGYSGKAMFNSSFTLTSKTRIQFNNTWNAPHVSIDGEEKSFFYSTFAIKQDFLDRKLSVTFSMNDVFKTRTTHSITNTERHYIDSKMLRQAPLYVITAGYRFNQTNKPKGERRKKGGDSMDLMF